MVKITGNIFDIKAGETTARSQSARTLTLEGNAGTVTFMMAGINKAAKLQLIGLPTRRLVTAMQVKPKGRWFSLKFKGTSIPQKFQESDAHMEFNLINSTSEYLIVFDHKSTNLLKSNGIGEAELAGQVCEIVFEF